jgi:hypothetical protein
MVRGGSSVTVGSRRAVMNGNVGRQQWGRGGKNSARRVGWVSHDPTHIRWSAIGAADLSWAEWANYGALVERFDCKPKRTK